jgi:membrane-associated HD superfamily phosphohydrolase
MCQIKTMWKKSLLPSLLIAIGTLSLLSAPSAAPWIDSAWAPGLAVTGLLIFLIGGVNKVTAVTGPFFLIASYLTVLRQTNRLSLDVDVPLLVIIAGVLLLVVRHSAIPLPRGMVSGPEAGELPENG